MINRLKLRPQPRGDGRKAAGQPVGRRPDADAGQPWAAKLEHLIGDHPAICLGAAVAIGVFVGWLVKRR
jgi:ElaB/YqjD/DUF883 family membrane-anchored ribosome-binding protein